MGAGDRRDMHKSALRLNEQPAPLVRHTLCSAHHNPSCLPTHRHHPSSRWPHPCCVPRRCRCSHLEEARAQAHRTTTTAWLPSTPSWRRSWGQQAAAGAAAAARACWGPWWGAPPAFRASCEAGGLRGRWRWRAGRMQDCQRQGWVGVRGQVSMAQGGRPGCGSGRGGALRLWPAGRRVEQREV